MREPSETIANSGPKNTLPPPLKPALLRREEAAAYLAISPMTFERLRAGDPTFPKALPVTKNIAGLAIRWKRADIDKWIAAQSQAA